MRGAMKYSTVIALVAALCAAPAVAHDGRHHQAPAQAKPAAATMPDLAVLDQDGKRLRFSDLTRGRTVAINFIYTSCTTLCPMLTANFRKVQEDLGARVGRDISLISITVDPATDTPAKLKAFGAQFEAASGWSFVTGPKPTIDKLLLALGQVPGKPDEHTPLVMVRNDRVGGWTHVDGNDPAAIREALVAAAGPAPSGSADATGSARNYMQNPQLVTQDGTTVAFFDDLVRGKIVLINFIFTTCTDSCPMVTANLARVQELLGDKVGRSIHMISLSVDPQRDRPPQLKAFAANVGAGPGWFFLTGESAEIDPLLRRLGGYTAEPRDHNTALIIGNVEAGVWTKISALAAPQDIARAVLAMRSPAAQ